MRRPAGPAGRLAGPAHPARAGGRRGGGRAGPRAPGGRSSSPATAPGRALPELIALAERLGAPVLTTFRAKGLLPDDHPLAAGVLGRSGTPVASWLMNESDLVLVVGASFSNHTGIATYKTLVAIDDSPGSVGRFNPVDAGDPRPTPGSRSPPWTRPSVRLRRRPTRRPDVAARQAIWRAEKARRAADDRGKGLAAAAVFDALSRHAPADCVFTVDVGNHAYSFGRYLESKGQPVLMSGYLGSIGFGYPGRDGRVGG